MLGHPIAHSKSPALHAAAYRQLGLDFGYAAQDLQAEELDGFIRRVRADGNWFGLSVTMPLKTAIVPLLDALEGAAATLGVVNTVVATGVRLVGYNTDVAGIVNALRHAGVREQPSAAILGGGGTAVAAVAALEALGAPAADLFVRDAGRSSAAGRPPPSSAWRTAFAPGARRPAPWPDTTSLFPRCPLMQRTPSRRTLRQPRAPPGGCLLDVAYDPWPSGLAAVWEARGGTMVPGLEMLLYQAVEQVRLFTSAALDARDAPSGVGSRPLSM